MEVPEKIVMTLIKKCKDKAWFFLHLHRRNRIIARFGRLCKNIHRATEHPTHDTLVNGEKAAVMRLAGGVEPVIFDVGANIGDWSAMTLALFPKATLHAFELSPVTAEPLTARFASADNVHVHPFGLADRTATVDFYAYSGSASILSSIRTPLYQHVPHTIAKAQVVRGDEFCQTHSIDFINFLKVDAENADMEVLQGFTNMLQKGKVGCIQFEHQGGRFLKEFYDFLKPMGYSIGKLYANYIDFREYEQPMEDFLGPNYIALPTRESAKIKEMIKGW
jgi:FkbM family methyltransferase